MILESIVTSVDPRGRVNIAPMGPRVDKNIATDDRIAHDIVLRPFNTSRTYRNLVETGKAVIHVTDDAGLFAQAAVDAIGEAEAIQLVRRFEDTDWWILRDCHRWFAVEVESISDDEPRVDIKCRVIHTGIERPFFGFNRARHAVIEAAILATRTHVLSPDEILSGLERLRPLIDKTGGANEHEAFDFLNKTIHERLDSTIDSR